MEIISRLVKFLIVLCSLGLIINFTGTRAYATNFFVDVGSSHYANDAISALAEKGILNGNGDGTFNPNGQITRQDFSIILAKALELDTVSSPQQPTFSDVPTTHYAFPYIEASVQSGLIAGVGDGQFGLGTLTREQMAVLFVRALGEDVSGRGENLTFEDTNSISDWARDSVAYALEIGLIQGMGNNRFNPRSEARRADAALVAFDFIKVRDEHLSPEPEEIEEEIEELEPKPEPQVPSSSGSGSKRKPTPKPEEPTKQIVELDDLSFILGVDNVEFIDLSDTPFFAGDELLDITINVDEIGVVEITADAGVLFVNPTAKGTAQVTITANDGNIEAVFTVTVTEPIKQIVSLDNLSFSLGADNAKFIDLSETPFVENGELLDLTIEMDEVDIVEIEEDDSGILVNPIGEGTATITITADNGNIEAVFTVTIAVNDEDNTLQMPPVLTGTLKNPTVEFDFLDDAIWRAEITGVFLNGNSVPIHTSRVDKNTAGKITINLEGVTLPTGNHNFVIKATDYEDAVITVVVP